MSIDFLLMWFVWLKNCVSQKTRSEILQDRAYVCILYPLTDVKKMKFAMNPEIFRNSYSPSEEELMQKTIYMCGFITENNWREIEEAFPGIYRYYQGLQKKPKTFLELQWRFVTSR